MTNKLRSVINKAQYVTAQSALSFPDLEEKYIRVEICNALIQDTVIHILDALIEEIEESIKKEENEFLKYGDYSKGYLFALETHIEQLKQAREELSTL